MAGVVSAMAGIVGGAGSVALDTQTVVSGADGTVLDEDRRRGFVIAPYGIGSISDGTSNIYSGAAIQALGWDEGGGAPFYFLTISGAANSGWTKLVIDGTTTLNRADATFFAGSWEWSGAPFIGFQAFGNSGTTHICVFS